MFTMTIANSARVNHSKFHIATKLQILIIKRDTEFVTSTVLICKHGIYFSIYTVL